jgi:hypothetical protein
MASINDSPYAVVKRLIAAILTLALLAPLVARPTPADAAAGMDVGAVLINPTNFSTQVARLQRMRATSVRLQMYYKGFPDSPVFTKAQIDQLYNAGIRRFILRSAEAPDAATMGREFFSDRTSDGWTMWDISGTRADSWWFFELNNEPNMEGKSPYNARWDTLTFLKDNRPGHTRNNLRYIVSMPTPVGGAGYTGAQYFDAYMRDTGDGLGCMLYSTAAGCTNVPYAPDGLGVHFYGDNSLDRNDSKAPYTVYDWVRGWSSTIPIYATEAGVNGGSWDGKAYLLNDFYRNVPTGTYIVTYFAITTDGSWPTYSITDGGASIIGAR